MFCWVDRVLSKIFILVISYKLLFCNLTYKLKMPKYLDCLLDCYNIG